MKNNRSIILVTSLAILLLLGMEALLVARIYRLQRRSLTTATGRFSKQV
jgi:Tfp pilus assembly protein PilX